VFLKRKGKRKNIMLYLRALQGKAARIPERRK